MLESTLALGLVLLSEGRLLIESEDEEPVAPLEADASSLEPISVLESTLVLELMLLSDGVESVGSTLAFSRPRKTRSRCYRSSREYRTPRETGSCR